MNKHLNIVVANQYRCSGACAFCHGANYELARGLNHKDLVNSLVKIDNDMADAAQIDFGKLEETLLKHPFMKADKLTFTLWGSDPLTCFINFQECYDFLKYLEEKTGKKIDVHASTNGLPFARKEIVEWLLKHNDIKLQFSHDGLGQYFRTFDTNPIDFDGAKELMKAGIVHCVSAVLNQWNALPIENIEYFNSKLEGTNTKIRLWTPHLGDYQGTELNRTGLLNGQNYKELENIPFGDYLIRNDVDLANKTGIFQLAHQCDSYFNQMDIIMKTWNDTKWNRLRATLLRRIYMTVNNIIDTNDWHNIPKCAQYHHGVSDYSDAIDTMGRFTECHLLDGTEHVCNPEIKLAKACESCKYNNSLECRMCGTMPKLKDDYVCQWNYRWNEWCHLIYKYNSNLKDWFNCIKCYGGVPNNSNKLKEYINERKVRKTNNGCRAQR